MYRKMCGLAVGVVLAWGMVGGEVLAQISEATGKFVNAQITHAMVRYTGMLPGMTFYIGVLNSGAHILINLHDDYIWNWNPESENPYPTNAGTYPEAVIITGKGDYDGSTAKMTVVILPAQVNKPILNSAVFSYTGDEHTVGLSTIGEYTLGGDVTKKDAGNYTATVTLNNQAGKSNYEWKDGGGTAPLSLSWSITPQPVTKPTLTQTSFAYNGDTHSIALPSTAGYTVTGTVEETNVGNYTATATLNNPVGKSNYEWSDGGTDPLSLSWSITPQTVVKPTLTQTSFAYNGGEHAVALSVPAETDKYTLGGVVSAINAGSYTATVALIDPVNYQWEDGTAANVSLPWTIAADISSVLSSGREFPNAAPDNSAVVIAPVNVSAFEVSAGPNPVRKSDGGINIFVSGKRVDDGTLTVYDGSGNVIRKINIRDNAALGNNGQRVVGSWDLRDAKGNHVSAGSYLLRGSVKTVDGKREKVSVVVGVR